jgi:hypothetical protein
MIRPLAAGALAMVLGTGLCACPSVPARDAAGTAAETAATATPPALQDEPRMHPPAIPAPGGLPSEPGEAGLREFLAAFLQARVIGDATRARDFLSPIALDQFERHEKGLNLVAISFTGWELLSVNAADANSWEIRVKMRREDEPVEEMLFVGPGADTSGTQRTWIVRGAGRP